MKMLNWNSVSIQCLAVASLFACNARVEKTLSEVNPVEGTWELVSETKIEKGDTTFTPASKDQRMVKIINKTHFAFLRHDLAGGKDSTAMFVAGGGKYSFNDGQYVEELEYCNFREWENHRFDFKVDVQGDSLTQTGKEKVEGLGIERVIIEKYVRTK